MKIHVPDSKADWELSSPDQVNAWQRLAIATNGICTPANALSIAGLLLVMLGAAQLYSGNWTVGLALVVVGRLTDIADGYVADATKTKSSLGEIVDTTCDKTSLFIIIIVALTTRIINPGLLTVVIVYNLYTALFGIVWSRQYHLHATLYGKLAAFMSWVAITFSIIYFKLPSPAILAIEIATIAIYIILCCISAYTYFNSLQKAIISRLRAARWTHEVTDFVYLSNPKASNYRRSEKLLEALSQELGHTPTRIDLIKQEERLNEYLGDTSQSQTILIAIGGGDGTLHSAVNMLANHLPAKAPRIYVLPLWGGKANDFAYMLNGLYSMTSPKRLLAKSAIVSIPLIRISLKQSTEEQVIYACSYASFGTSAYAARQLNTQRFSSQRLMRWIPPLLLLHELSVVFKVLFHTHDHVTTDDREETRLYEHTLINGSRIAKVNRIPVELDEPVFFHAMVEKKDPSLLISLMHILLNKPDAYYSKKEQLSFTTKDAVDAQFDGEPHLISSGAQVTASVIYTPIRFISTRLPVKPKTAH